MDLELSGKVAVVTGASKGIGLAVTRALAAEGAEVVAGARTIDSLLDMDGVSAFEVDLIQAGGSERPVGNAVERHGRVDVLVNNVGGVCLRLDGFLQTSDADFEAVRAGRPEQGRQQRVELRASRDEVWIRAHGITVAIYRGCYQPAPGRPRR
jgi:NAD(P)-dependent dehydrogenase (short-subunit alcohol dehydrogenase family)